MLSAPAGRVAEWDRLLARLKARKAALVLIAGRPGSGRTTLLVAIAAAGRELGCSVIGGQDAVTVDRTMRPSDLRRIVASVLGATVKAPTKNEPATHGFLRLIAGLFFRPSSDKKSHS